MSKQEIVSIPMELYEKLKEWIIDKQQKGDEKTEPNVPIEFETVKIKVPKPIMDFLRKTDVDNEGPEAWIEWQIVESVRAYLECEHTEEWVTVFKLGPVFRKVLGDKNYS